MTNVSLVSKTAIILSQGVAVAILLMALGFRMIIRNQRLLLPSLVGVFLFLSFGGGLIFESVHEYRVRKRAENSQFINFTNISPDLLKWMDGNVLNKTIIEFPLQSGYDILPYPLFGSRFNNIALTGPRFSEDYRPPANVDLIVLSGRKKNAGDGDSVPLPAWSESWGKEIGFHCVFSDGVQTVYQRKYK